MCIVYTYSIPCLCLCWCMNNTIINYFIRNWGKKEVSRHNQSHYAVFTITQSFNFIPHHQIFVDYFLIFVAFSAKWYHREKFNEGKLKKVSKIFSVLLFVQAHTKTWYDSSLKCEKRRGTEKESIRIWISGFRFSTHQKHVHRTSYLRRKLHASCGVDELH